MRGAPHVAAQFGLRRHVGGLVGIGVQCEILGYLPDEDLDIVSS
jgi:hypothetical protein